MNVQIIEKNGHPEWAIIPYKEFAVIQEALEDVEDIRDIEENLRAIQNTNSVVPGEITFAVLDGANPIRAWRQFKKIRLGELANTAGISSSYLSQLENGKRNPAIATLKAIAAALRIDTEQLM